MIWRMDPFLMPPMFCIGMLLQHRTLKPLLNRTSHSANTPHIIRFVPINGDRGSFHLCDNDVRFSTERFCHLFTIVSRHLHSVSWHSLMETHQLANVET